MGAGGPGRRGFECSSLTPSLGVATARRAVLVRDALGGGAIHDEHLKLRQTPTLDFRDVGPRPPFLMARGLSNRGERMGCETAFYYCYKLRSLTCRARPTAFLARSGMHPRARIALTTTTVMLRSRNGGLKPFWFSTLVREAGGEPHWAGKSENRKTSRSTSTAVV